MRLAQISEREGRRNEAATRYAQVLRGDPYEVAAWWGLSQTIANAEYALYCVKRVLAIDPGHAEAKQHLNHMTFAVMLGNLETGDSLGALAHRSLEASLNKPIFN